MYGKMLTCVYTVLLINVELFKTCVLHVAEGRVNV